MQQTDQSPFKTDPFRAVAEMAEPLEQIRDLLIAISYLSDETEHMSTPIGGVTIAAQKLCKEVDALHTRAWRATHPFREEFERTGWPGDAP